MDAAGSDGGEDKARTRVDQNMSSALLEFPMRTAMHGKSPVSSAISVCDN